MSHFTEAFQILDYGNKGYILINDFKKEMQTYLFNDDGNVNTDSEKTLNKFISFLKYSEDNKVYFDNFKNAIQELEQFSSEATSKNDNKEHGDCLFNSDFSPFINDGDNYSTGDSGFSNDLRTCQDFDGSMNSGIGKHNRKLIKKFHTDTNPVKEISPSRYIQNELKNSEINDSRLPGYDNSYGLSGRRRQRSFAASDFVTCSSRKIKNRQKHNIDDDSCSLTGWNACSGSAADLFYHDSMTDIQSTLEKLERSMENLQTITSDSKNSKRKSQDENYVLIGQIQSLEEKLRESQRQFENDLNLEREATRKNLVRMEKSKFEEIEYLKWSLKTKEDDLESQWKELQAVSTDNERLLYDKLRTEDKLQDLQQQMLCIESEMNRLKDYHNRELNVLINERNILFSRNSDLNNGQSSNQGSNSTKEDIGLLRSENQNLRRRLEECESEFLAISVQQGQSILQSTSVDSSWMTEIDGYSKDEIINLLVKEKDGNFRLREYVTRILTRIIDKDPALLEI